MRDSWTDERLDDFAANTERRFVRLEARFDRLERRIETGFAELRKEMDARFDRIDGRIDALHHTLNRGLLQFGTGLIVTIALGFAGLIFGH